VHQLVSNALVLTRQVSVQARPDEDEDEEDDGDDEA
jgi:hypothetical protein